MVEAEYENWLADEAQKCDRIGSMIEKSSNGKEKEVEGWVKGYCGDCKDSLKGMREGRRGLL